MSETMPQNRASIIEHAGPRGLRVYDVVREIVDDLDEAAPWVNLYSPPETERAFLDMENSLLAVIEGIPGRIQMMFESLDEERGSNDMSSGKLASFFDNTFLIISRDRDRLTDVFANESGQKWNNERRSLVCDLSADLKGKYQSALMGVAGQVIATGRWPGAEIEAVLFPEKAEQCKRTRDLVEALRKTTAMIRDLTRDMPFAECIASWSEEKRVDQYALVDLTIVVGAIGQLLKQNTRRALYSGDYHRILGRERVLSEKVRKLQIMHASSWSETIQMSAAVLFPLLIELSHEIAAILDANLLRTLVGESRFNELKKGVENPKNNEPLVEHLRHHDLSSFLESLLAHVFKRESLSVLSKSNMKDEDHESTPHEDAKRVFGALIDVERPQWQAFLAITAESKATPVLAMEFKQDVFEKLVPSLMKADSLKQFGKVLASTCRDIESAADIQSMKTALRLINRLRRVFDEHH